MSVIEIVVVNTVNSVDEMNEIIEAADSESPGHRKRESIASVETDIDVRTTPSAMPTMPVSSGHAHRRELSNCLIRLKNTLMASAYKSALHARPRATV